MSRVDFEKEEANLSKACDTAVCAAARGSLQPEQVILMEAPVWLRVESTDKPMSD